jgi:hypothetical protein
MPHFGGGGMPHAGGAMPHVGGGAVPHIGGGAVPHFGGGGGFGGAAHVGGGMHFGGAPRIGGGGVHVGGVPHAGGGMRIGGGPHFGGARVNGRPAVSHFAGRSGLHTQRAFAAHGNAPTFANGRAAAGTSRMGHNRPATLSPNENAAAAARSASGGLRPGFSQNHASLAQGNRALARSSAVHNVLSSRAVAGALQNRTALINPGTRAQITAAAATAAWQGGRTGAGGWWRHGNGGYGWIGPVFWPFAYYDLYDYTLWGYGYDDPFWDYGYVDVYAGLFGPYSYDEMVAYLPPAGGGAGGTVGRVSGGGGTAMAEQLAPFCGNDSRGIADLPIDQIQDAIQPNDEQRAALDDLANASIKAAQDIRAACPTQVPLTAPARLAAMQFRIEAMFNAANTVLPPLQKFYDLLSEDQKVRLNALAQDQRGRDAARNRNAEPVRSCGTGQPGVTDWPTAEIEARVHPTQAQRASLDALRDASAKAADMLNSSCPATEPITPPARLEAIIGRLQTMLQAVKMVRSALDDFYGQLTDEQKAQFEAIGPQRTARAEQTSVPPPTHVRHYRHHASVGHYRHHPSIAGLFRHFMAMVP